MTEEELEGTVGNNSKWREYEFIYHQIIQAVRITIPLKSIKENWSRIKRRLAENPRQRQLQLILY